MTGGRRLLYTRSRWRGLVELRSAPLLRAAHPPRPRARALPLAWECRCRCLSNAAKSSSTPPLIEPLSAALLPPRINPRFFKSSKPGSSLLSLHWPQPPRNLLLVLKLFAPNVTESVVEFAKHIHSEYPAVNIVLEPRVAPLVQQHLDFPVHVVDQRSNIVDKIDVIATFGGDGTVLRAASLYQLHGSVPPILSFSMGTLGFLGEWNFSEHKKAWKEVYMSGSDAAPSRKKMSPQADGTATTTATASGGHLLEDQGQDQEQAKGWGHEAHKSSRVLLRHRIKADIFDRSGNNINHKDALAVQSTSGVAGPKEHSPSLRAINEISVHRGSYPHLAIIDIYQNGHFLTETTADGILISTPTGSTAYSLSAGGPIVHPLVKSLLITPISPCSLSFRSLVLPLDTKVCLRISPKNRGQDLDLSIDGKRCAGVLPGSEIHVEGEFVGRVGPNEEWHGGVPCVIRAEDDDPWVGGLTGLLKFNHPFGRGPFGEEFPD